ncbi:5160_t:CDS:2 [Rhizophagus irregularis]|nr:5160_t:CDS:2 [Rhizophagus irregularis]
MVKNVKRIDRHVKQQQLEQLSTGFLKLYHYPDENNWKFQYDTISTAKRYLKAEKYLSQAQHALLGSHI